jgi:hypothetical protein
VGQNCIPERRRYLEVKSQGTLQIGLFYPDAPLHDRDRTSRSAYYSGPRISAVFSHGPAPHDK